MRRLAQHLNQITEQSAAGLLELNEIGTDFDVAVSGLLASHPLKERLFSILNEMMAAARTLEYEREELRRFGVQLAE